jgi:hypothetical protein
VSDRRASDSLPGHRPVLEKLDEALGPRRGVLVNAGVSSDAGQLLLELVQLSRDEKILPIALETLRRSNSP